VLRAPGQQEAVGCTIISLCEFVDDPAHVKYFNKNEVITVDDEELVVTRFLFVFPGGLNGAVRLAASDLTYLLKDLKISV
jgi:hypothetical protein